MLKKLRKYNKSISKILDLKDYPRNALYTEKEKAYGFNNTGKFNRTHEGRFYFRHWQAAIFLKATPQLVFYAILQAQSK